MWRGPSALATGQSRNMGSLWPLDTFYNRGHQVCTVQGPQGVAPCPRYLPQLSPASFTLVIRKYTKSRTGCPYKSWRLLTAAPTSRLKNTPPALHTLLSLSLFTGRPGRHWHGAAVENIEPPSPTDSEPTCSPEVAASLQSVDPRRWCSQHQAGAQVLCKSYAREWAALRKFPSGAESLL